ncbi:urea ABC transporter substrate-binding protein [Spirulina subsalsa]|uniref:urea ABC transporter substrate-binding protein n=1 Tax=Spirulina subsalsa TaxID=54311 RepID=UPI0002E45E8B|nr:urea ABC transporter substrate-binding protein [Spirulina subsalsa]
MLNLLKKNTWLMFLILASFLTILLLNPLLGRTQDTPIKVGVLHSLTGTMAISEKPVVEATLMAIEEINQQGGVFGRRIEPIVVDGASNWDIFAELAEKLIVEDQVITVFGCWTSASRKTVKPIFEKYDHLLIYPVQYEGLEASPNILYTGAAPNQQILPAVKWAFNNLGKRFFLVGSDYIFPHVANTIVREQLSALNAEILGEEYLLLGTTQVQNVIEKILETQPDVVINTINGDTNIAFFNELKKANITAESIPVISLSIGENELQSFDPDIVKGHYAAWNYFQSIDSLENEKFIHNFREKYGENRMISDPMEAAYVGVYLWKQAIEKTPNFDIQLLRENLKDQSLSAPQGPVYVDPQTQHLWKTVRVGQIDQDAQFKIVWSSGKPVRPIPYPMYRSETDWNKLLQQYQLQWRGQWSNPKTE